MTSPDSPELRKRINTRKRLVAAALDVFADRGYGSTTVRDVCAAAGFTRGAFYSNFSSLDDLYLEMLKQNADALVGKIRDIGAAMSDAEAVSVEDAVRAIDDALGIDARWFRLYTEFQAMATRTPAVLPLFQEQERNIRNEFTPVLRILLGALGRRAADDDELTCALLAAHDGTVAQCLTQADHGAARKHRITLLTTVIEAYTAHLSAD